MAEYISPYDGCRFDTDFISREAARCLMYHTQMPLTEKDLMSIPSADVAPVRHGRWVKTIGENGVTSACRCNLCGFEDNRYSLFNYCPNCGAKMDGGNSDER